MHLLCFPRLTRQDALGGHCVLLMSSGRMGAELRSSHAVNGEGENPLYHGKVFINGLLRKR